MDLQSESSVLESVEANGALDSDKLVQVNEHQTENNGTLVVNVPAASFTPPAKAKGFGLKKWRRIKREVNKDGCYSSDAGKTLRRGSVTVADKPTGLSAEISIKSDGSLSSSTNAEMRNVGFNAGIAFDSGSAIGHSFDAETDSDNSEDHSSKSSTAASIPKLSRKTASWMGYQPDSNRVKNQSDITIVADPFQRGKSQKETSKKARGERIKIEKEENSRSSMESDSRSTNVLFIDGKFSMNNGRRFNGKSTNCDEDNLDEILDGEPKINCEHQDDYDKENGNSEDTLQDDFAWTAKGKSDNCISSTAHDPLVESILALQFAQEMLEKEVVGLKEVEISLLKEPTQNSCLHSELMGEKSFDLLDSKVISLKYELSKLKDKLEESAAFLKQKEDKVFELEEALNLNSSTIDDMQDILKGHQKKETDMEAEIECLFNQKIETEIQFIVVSRSIHKFDDELAFDEEELMHEGKFEEVETHSTKLVESDEVLKLENKAYQVGLYSLVQLILFFVVFVLFFGQLSNYYSGIVPT
ncbi:WPP domain-interacting protein 2 [Impatiens glandulifera]|uniref:WPP domain-interacting protein 2 n=1 Tax=Impatiens glandulifera TaxID=253017 RepID=UPI001FB1419D|nr:WPP domain-interacting protein 2 [Impatiens glandulifera]